MERLVSFSICICFHDDGGNAFRIVMRLVFCGPPLHCLWVVRDQIGEGKKEGPFSFLADQMIFPAAKAVVYPRRVYLVLCLLFVVLQPRIGLQVCQ